jgi:hypothetical protein
MMNMKMAYNTRWFLLGLCLLTAALILGACLPKQQPQPTPPPEPPKNQSPLIQSLTAEPIANPAGKYKVVCTASDPEGDALEYWWTADGGMVEGTGDSVIWTAPEAGGAFNVKVMVRDKKGAEASQSVAVTAASRKNDPPRIVKMTIDNKDAIEVNQVKIWLTSNIHCVAEDPEGGKLTYMWSATGGEIKGEGPIVQWIAPGVSGDHIIKVRAIDDRGAEAESTLKFHVKCCGR